MRITHQTRSAVVTASFALAFVTCWPGCGASRSHGVEQPSSPDVRARSSDASKSETAGANSQQAGEHSAPEFPGLERLPEDEVDAYSVDHPFETTAHTDMVRAGSQPSFCIELLASAQWRQDIVLSTWAPAHFDNCRFDDAQRYLAELIADAEKAAVAGKRDAMLVAIGRGLHGIQDFYSHTNYVELMALEYESLSQVPVVEVWQPDGAKRVQELQAKGLVSGYVFWEPGNSCLKPVRTHADLSKDSPDSPGGGQLIKGWNVTGYRAAQELAVRATRSYLHAFLSRPAWAKLVEDCKGLAFTLSIDRRSHGAQR